MKNRHRVSQVVSKLVCSRAARRKILRQGAADRGQHRQAAGAVAERLNVMREQMKGSDRCFRCAPKLGLDYCFGVASPPPRRFSRRSWRPVRRA